MALELILHTAEGKGSYRSVTNYSIYKGDLRQGKAGEKIIFKPKSGGRNSRSHHFSGGTSSSLQLNIH